MAETTAFKDYYNRDAARAIAERFAEVFPAFDVQRFVRRATRGLSKLEFKQRIAQFSDALGSQLPEDFADAATIIAAALPEELDGDDGPLEGGFHVWPIAHFVETSGIGAPDAAIPLLRLITTRFTSEFAVRPYIAAYPERMIAQLTEWARDDNEHVRRLVSEGTRTRLPWATRVPWLNDNPDERLALLELLKEDPARYVQRSVANHLNDIVKDDRELALDVLERWSTIDNDATQWIVRHASRNLIKEGEPRALALFGYLPPSVTVSSFEFEPKRVAIGDAGRLLLALTNDAPDARRLVIDYAVHFVKSNGSTSRKVFKLVDREVAAGERVTVRRAHSFVQRSTRKHYAGDHVVDVQVNGVIQASCLVVVTD